MYVSKGTTINKLLEELKEHSQVQLNMAYKADSDYAEELMKRLRERNRTLTKVPIQIDCVIENFEGYINPSFIFSITPINTNKKAKFLLSDILE